METHDRHYRLSGAVERDLLCRLAETDPDPDTDPDLEVIVFKVKLAGNQLLSLYPNHDPTDEQIKAVTRAAGLPVTDEDIKLHDDPMRQAVVLSGYKIVGDEQIRAFLKNVCVALRFDRQKVSSD